MRHIRCKKCLSAAKVKAGTRQIYPRSSIGEPAEFERVVIGHTGTPKPEQRWMAINGEKHPLPLGIYNCDGCGAEIKPGDVCYAWSVWIEGHNPPPAWESEFLTPFEVPF